MKFLADAMLARPGRWLRMFGYDTEIADAKTEDNELLEKARKDNRILVTRDKFLTEKAEAWKVPSLYIKTKNHREQIEEIVKHFKLKINFPKNTRCPQCNGMLEITEKNADVPEKVESDTYWRCKNCGKMYWKGTYWEKIQEIVKKLS